MKQALDGRVDVSVVDGRTGKSRSIVSEFLDGGHWDNHMLAVET
jgi:hypothetical protein